ncbi:Putative uncharacterized protein [Moritella viscosa]|uniref:Uncharacterized protein n=1 Tax=Moritella viscosa TaxID=80854 RepID=A0A1K9Z1N7_9GAMM|nr:Putative uncharacterized protein [Moritella viscosa]SGY89837.1 Putative uncharacterized protein [Moritella viscosa]SGY92090.1 Putative uncharacterized protein [Moritella viscosa]SGY92438.1 Putative uncharacterized protein [Moritella viscosa]SGZ02637.1 Putative uncharacterized protein [Moritella viscosa]
MVDTLFKKYLAISLTTVLTIYHFTINLSIDLTNNGIVHEQHK